MTNRINRLLPENKFEFIIASSEYAIRKPDKILFEIALRKAGLQADQVWYCGDSIQNDVIGAHGAGLYPILYEGNAPDEVNSSLHQSCETKLDFDYLHIHDWCEMIEILKDI